MAGSDRSRGGRTGEAGQAGRARPKATAERPFDTWLQKQLHAMYDEIASEPLPHDLLGLIDRDAAKSDEKNTREKDGGLAKGAPGRSKKHR